MSAFEDKSEEIQCEY